MHIRVQIDKAAALEAGRDSYGLSVVEAPASALSEGQREILAQFHHAPDRPDGPVADFYLDRHAWIGPTGTTYSGLQVVEPTLPEVKRLLDEVAAKAVAEAQALRDEEERRESERRQAFDAAVAGRKTTVCHWRVTATRDDGEIVVHVDDWVPVGVDDWATPSYAASPRELQVWFAHFAKPDFPNGSGDLVAASPEAQAWIAELTAARDAAVAAGEEGARRGLLAVEAQAEAERQERSAWIAAHGSERLRRCVAEGVECDAVYRDERLAAERPGWAWYDDVPGSYGDPRNPPAEAFAVLDAARAVDPAAELVYAGSDEDGPQYAAKAKFLGREIVCGWPNGESE